MYDDSYLGYYIGKSKSWLITKEEYIKTANEIFQKYNIYITTNGHHDLSTVIGSNENKEEYVITKVAQWVKQLEILTHFTSTEPQKGFSGFINGLRHCYAYFMRTIPEISHILKRLKILLQGYAFHPCPTFTTSKMRWNGIKTEYGSSPEITKETTNKVICNEIQFQDNRVSTAKVKHSIKNQKKKLNDAKLQEVMKKSSCKTKLRSIEASTENGASIWLIVIPIKRIGFFLEKQVFWDAIRIRYNIPLERLPTLCICGDSFNLRYASSCPKGGLVITIHNTLTNITAEILGEVYKNVVIEPLLTPLMGEEFPRFSNTGNQARRDVSAGGL